MKTNKKQEEIVDSEYGFESVNYLIIIIFALTLIVGVFAKYDVLDYIGNLFSK